MSTSLLLFKGDAWFSSYLHWVNAIFCVAILVATFLYKLPSCS